ncbi:hypothetical protein NC651_004064 [Populus alba x Populus x berolinensis]|nr:hypothetical protein NC651_004064 [Populus alba x Populus x berolinensis]
MVANDDEDEADVYDSKHADSAQLQDTKSESFTELPRPQSVLTMDCFYNKEAKRQKNWYIFFFDSSEFHGQKSSMAQYVVDIL